MPSFPTLSAKGTRKEDSAKEQSSHEHGDCREASRRKLLVLTDRVILPAL
jgi:hypothetical protein